MQTFKKLFYLLNPYEQKLAGLLLLMMIVMAILEMIGVASILPFMAVLTNPDVIENNFIFYSIFQKFASLGVENKEQFIFALGIIVFLLLMISLVFKALTNYAEVRFVQMRECSIGKRLVEGYLHQPYTWFLNRNSADLGKNILSEVDQVITKGITPIMTLLAKGLVAIFIIILLIISDPKIALIVGLILCCSYGFLFYLIRRYLNKIGKIRLKNNQLRFMSVSEAFGAIKEIKLKGLEQTHIKNFYNSAKTLARVQASSQVVALLPRYILEAIAFGGILLMILFMMKQSGSFINALPILSLYVFAGYRLMPALQQMYVSFTQLTYVGPAIDKLYDDLNELKSMNLNSKANSFNYNKKISLKNIYYNYPNTKNVTLKNINLSIPIKSTIGLVGTTGSGKTTMVDIILGLLDPSKGTLEVDEQIISKKNVRSWQSTIGYVPQHIYLADDTIAANIAFGVDAKEIDQDAIEFSSKTANLHDFVSQDLPQKYQTIVGERGARLSGGQRQRIGIARALYHCPQTLILDEATSALDNQTEQAIMDSINKLSKEMTIIIIAHRLSTLKKCDQIFLIEKGEIKKTGTFEEVINTYEKFHIKSN